MLNVKSFYVSSRYFNLVVDIWIILPGKFWTCDKKMYKENSTKEERFGVVFIIKFF